MSDAGLASALVDFDSTEQRHRLLTRVLPASWYLVDVAPGLAEVGARVPAGTLRLPEVVLRPVVSGVAAPALFGGIDPPEIYVDMLIAGTVRAARLARGFDSIDDATVAEEIVAIHGSLLARELRYESISWQADWLSRRAGRAGAACAFDRKPCFTPSYGLLQREFIAATPGWPADHRYEVVSRLAHIQARRLIPESTLADETALLRATLSELEGG
jgi:hypothetical protein